MIDIPDLYRNIATRFPNPDTTFFSLSGVCQSLGKNPGIHESLFSARGYQKIKGTLLVSAGV
jgi:hypothetical protein